VYIFTMLAVLPLILLFSTLAQSPVVGQSKAFESIVNQAEAARSADRVNEAIALYGKALHQRPSWSEGWWWLGSLLYEQDRFSEAQEAFRQFVATAPKRGPGYAFLALCEYETHEYAQALLHFQAWTKEGAPGTRDLVDVANFHRALLLTREGQFTKALFLLEDILSTKTDESPALTEAMGLASLHMANLPEDYPPEKRELVWLAGKAAAYSSQEYSSKSEEYMHRLVLQYGGEPNVHYLCGNLLVFRRKYPEAAEEYKRELQISPQHVPAMIELALVQVQNLQTSEALALAKRAAALEPKNPRAVYALGKSLLAADRFAESAHELELAKQLAPESASVRSALAGAYRGLGRKEDAKREAAAFLSLEYARVHHREQAESLVLGPTETPR
jgi:tetratricopeptide (TPR) repeat protein